MLKLRKKKFPKKSVVANIIFTFILISIAVSAGIYLLTVFEKNKKIIQAQQFPQSFEAGIYTKYKVQDPEFIHFYLTSNYPTKVYITYKITSDSLEYTEEKVITGLTEVTENLSALFNVSPYQLDGKILDIIIRTDKGPQGFESISLSLSTKILNVFTNVPSYLQVNNLYNLYPGQNLLYLQINPSTATWYSPYQIKLIHFNTSKKVENITFKENYKLNPFVLTFKDVTTKEPIVGANLYINNFFVGYTDTNGQYILQYHNNSLILVELEDKCHYLSTVFTINQNKELFANNICRYTTTTLISNETPTNNTSPSYYWILNISNPNSYALTNYQLKIDLSVIKQTTSSFIIYDSNNNPINYTFETYKGEVTSSLSKWNTNYIWIKIPYIEANSNVIYKIIPSSSTYAVEGSQIFDFYDDFNDNNINDWRTYDMTATVNNGIVTLIPGSLTNFKHLFYRNILNLNTNYIVDYYVNDKYSAGGLVYLFQNLNNWMGWENYPSFGYDTPRGYINNRDTGWLNIFFTVFNNNEWLKVTVKVKGKDVEEITKYGSHIYSTDYGLTPNGIGFVEHRGFGPMYIDWIRIRKYADQQLTYTIKEVVSSQ